MEISKCFRLNLVCMLASDDGSSLCWLGGFTDGMLRHKWQGANFRCHLNPRKLPWLHERLQACGWVQELDPTGRAIGRQQMRAIQISGLAVIRPGHGFGDVLAALSSEEKCFRDYFHRDPNFATLRIEEYEVCRPMPCYFKKGGSAVSFREQMFAPAHNLRRHVHFDSGRSLHEVVSSWSLLFGTFYCPLDDIPVIMLTNPLLTLVGRKAWRVCCLPTSRHAALPETSWLDGWTAIRNFMLVNRSKCRETTETTTARPQLTPHIAQNVAEDIRRWEPIILDNAALHDRVAGDGSTTHYDREKDACVQAVLTLDGFTEVKDCKQWQFQFTSYKLLDCLRILWKLKDRTPYQL